MTGYKLITMGGSGSFKNFTQVKVDTAIVFTNPDCVSKIKIDRVSIIRDDCVTIYDGSLSGLPHHTAFAGDALRPHQVAMFLLRQCMPSGSGGWLSEEEAIAQPAHNYTVEIFYSVRNKGGLPLIGHAGHYEAPLDGVLLCVGIWQMDNMKQVLEPKKEKSLS